MLDLVITVFIWGLSFALAKKALNQFSPFELVFIRLALGAAVAFVIAALSTKEVTARDQGATKSSRRKAARKAAMFLGVFEFAGTYILYTWSLSYLPSGLVGALTLLTPAMTFLVGGIWKTNSFSWKGVGASALSFFGAALCLPLKAMSFSGAAFFGVILLMASNLFFAVGNVYISAHNEARDQRATAAGLFFGAVVAFFVAAATPRTSPEHVAHFSDWILPLFLGLVPTGLGFFLWNRGVAKTSAFPASLVGNFKAPLAVFWGAILLHESFDLKFFLGLILLFVSTQILPARKMASV